MSANASIDSAGSLPSARAGRQSPPLYLNA